MKALFKFAHIIVMGYFVITGNDLYDQILTGIIAVIGYIYAFSFTRSFSDGLEYDSNLMSFFHWTFRTMISIFMIFITRIIFVIFKSIIVITNENTSELIAVALCAVSWVLLAEILKSMTGLRKNYF